LAFINYVYYFIVSLSFSLNLFCFNLYNFFYLILDSNIWLIINYYSFNSYIFIFAYFDLEEHFIHFLTVYYEFNFSDDLIIDDDNVDLVIDDDDVFAIFVCCPLSFFNEG